MTVIDLFCGVGGFSLGFKQAGFTVSLAVANNNPDISYNIIKQILNPKQKQLEVI